MGVSQSFVETRDILEPLKEETIISFRARIASGAARFAIDLAYLNGDVAFHFNPRFDERSPVVVCNSFINAKWGREERNFYMPFCRGEYFEMTITVKNMCYEVSVNGKPYLAYDHRLPYHAVKKLHFKGDVSCEEVRCFSAKDPPPYCPPPQVDTEMTISNLKCNPV